MENESTPGKPKWVKFEINKESLAKVINSFKFNEEHEGRGIGDSYVQNMKNSRKKGITALTSLFGTLSNLCIKDLSVEIKEEPHVFYDPSDNNKKKPIQYTDIKLRLRRPGICVSIKKSTWRGIRLDISEQRINGAYAITESTDAYDINVDDFIRKLRNAQPHKRPTRDTIEAPKTFIKNHTTNSNSACNLWFKCTTQIKHITHVYVATIKKNLKVTTDIGADDDNAWFLIEGWGEESFSIVVDADVTGYRHLTKNNCIDIRNYALFSENDADFIRYAIAETMKGKNNGSETS